MDAIDAARFIAGNRSFFSSVYDTANRTIRLETRFRTVSSFLEGTGLLVANAIAIALETQFPERCAVEATGALESLKANPNDETVPSRRDVLPFSQSVASDFELGYQPSEARRVARSLPGAASVPRSSCWRFAPTQ